MKNILFVVFAFLAIGSVPTVKAQCDICQTVIQLIEGWVENNATVSQVEQYLDGICNLIPSYSSICTAIVNEGVPEILQYLEQNETPQQICTQLGLCSSVTLINGGLINDNKKPAIPLEKLKLITPGVLTTINKSTKVGDAQCDLCERVIGAFEQWLDNADDQAEVITAIEVVCTYMPEWETTCDAVVEAGVPSVVNWIETEENSTVVCGQLNICDSPKKIAAPQDDCGICEQIVTTVYYYVAQNYTESLIENYLDIACTIVPQWTSVCESFVQQELPSIIQYVEQNQTPDAICTSLGVCGSKKIPTVHIN